MNLTKALMCLSLAIDKRYLRHSIIIPFTSETLKNQFIKFKRLVITDSVTNNNHEIDETLFILPDSLHLTICQVDVPTEQCRQRSVNTFIECYHKHIKTQLKNTPLYVDIRGISTFSTFRDNCYHKTNVIYAKVLSNRLESISNNIIDEYLRAGLMSETSNYRKYKIPHITLMNSEYRNKHWHKSMYQKMYKNHALKVNDMNDNFIEEFRKQSKHTRRPFDASMIFDKFRDFVFCDDLIVDSIQISLKNVYYINFLMWPYDNRTINLSVNNNRNYNQLFLC